MFPLRYAFQPVATCHRFASPPRMDGRFAEWTSTYLLPEWFPGDGPDPFASVYAAWDEDHLYFAAQVNLRRLPRVNPSRFWMGDVFEIFLDLRGLLAHNEYTEHCVHFYFLPEGAGNSQPRGGRCEPAVETGVAVPDDPTLRVSGQTYAQGYRLEIALSREAVPTYDPVAYRSIGFNYLLRDAAGRVQYWSVGKDLATYRDPSTWGLLELVD